MVDGEVVFLNFIGFAFGDTDCYVSDGRELAATLARHSNNGHTECLCKRCRVKDVLCVARGRRSVVLIKDKLGFIEEDADASGGELFAKSSAKNFNLWVYDNIISLRTVVSTKGGARSARATKALCILQMCVCARANAHGMHFAKVKPID